MIDLRVLELLCARFCHELVSPVGAVSNGVELLGEDDPAFVREAIGLIGQSAQAASRRLQFYRFAYGTPPTATNLRPRELLAGLLDGGKVLGEWDEKLSSRSLEWQRVACNMAVLAAEALPRGGRVSVRAEPGEGVAVEAAGEAILLHPEVMEAISRDVPPMELTSRSIHGYMTAKFADRLGARIALRDSDGTRAAFVVLPFQRPGSAPSN
ncbi:MAG TPA: histidine phosphotransferase family protein [Stellaceae bacterium]|nr:histidine phosphotransferase family protein [Stellaceae bacterium]